MQTWGAQVPRERLDEPEIARAWLEMVLRLASVAGVPKVAWWQAKKFGRVVSVFARWDLDDELAAERQDR